MVLQRRFAMAHWRAVQTWGYAMCTLTNTRWVGGDRALLAQEIGSSLETQEWSESPPSTGMFTPVR